MPEKAGSVSSNRALLVLTVATVLAVLSFATAATLVQLGSPSVPHDPAGPPNWVMPVPSPPVSILPALPGGLPPSGPQALPVGGAPQPTGARPPRAGSVPKPSASTPHSAPASRSIAATGAPVSLTPGTTIGLGVAALPGYRVRHRGPGVSLDVLTAVSTAADRADARFVVRAGRADAGCLSFESADHPGAFLRHRDFVLRWEQSAGTALFDQDATFCPVTTGGATALRSANYPDRHLVVTMGGIQLTQVPAQWATGFQALAPL
ncbi:AbfB domain-containing protein [Actinoplanes sp. NPDC020271]|uniref:AbfB domain-containing protein n=1 Tax=Actinoplanes sp. NPDC020271 TaxID=3363896 RepID=UPI0037B44805